jgi:hypothetical protein
MESKKKKIQILFQTGKRHTVVPLSHSWAGFEGHYTPA